MPQTIMVLDDDPDISLLICALLTEEGYSTTAPTRAITDLDLLRESVPDLIILDLMLHKDVTTLATIEQLRRNPTWLPSRSSFVQEQSKRWLN